MKEKVEIRKKCMTENYVEKITHAERYEPCQYTGKGTI
jgi:hypothetical protein